MERGIEQGMKKGELFGKIRLYQQLLGLPEQSLEQLSQQATESLQTQLDQLHQDYQASH
jgi:hypothetical protein